MDDERAQRARIFGQAAELYDRWRPGYPEALDADVWTLGARGRVLEVGAGTGRATLALAQRGATVVAVEPDAAMATVARRHTRGMAVDVRESTFEDYAAATGTFDLIAAAQSWHWVDPDRGASVAARALRPGGALCVWRNRPRELAGPVWDVIRDAFAEHAPSSDLRPLLRQQREGEQQIEPALGFMPWTVRTYDWSAHYDVESLSGLVRTSSTYLQLPTAQRERLINAIRTAITNVLGTGQLEYSYRTTLLTAHVCPRVSH
ncbi:MAG: class I SAM-dependent methyltransferase [Pseudonocardiaceae bacterium]